VPRTATTDYGWITPGDTRDGALNARFRSVAGFVEKPSRDDARALFARRALWNTMVLVARAGTLMRLYEEHRPDVANLFAEYLRLPAALRPAFLADRYADLPSSDFSKDILTPAHGIAVFTWPESIGWSDLGTPDRLERWLAEEHTQGAA
jgi:mannose-1-phosphate guanylyltransferase